MAKMVKEEMKEFIYRVITALPSGKFRAKHIKNPDIADTLGGVLACISHHTNRYTSSKNNQHMDRTRYWPKQKTRHIINSHLSPFHPTAHRL